MSNVKLERKNKLLITLAGVIFVSVLISYYIIVKLSIFLKIFILLIGLISSSILFFSSETGRKFAIYFQESIIEVKKIVWPSRKETIQMTLVVFLFVIIMTIFLFLIDTFIEWIIFTIFLGWK